MVRQRYVSNIRTLHELNSESLQFNSITIKLDNLWGSVSLEYILLVALSKINLNGVVILRGDFCSGFDVGKKLNSWRLNSVVHKFFDEYFTINSYIDNKMKLVCTKEIPDIKTGSVVIIFSGDDNELSKLELSVSSLFSSLSYSGGRFKIRICGPKGSVQDTLCSKFPSLQFIESSLGYVEKKQYLLDHAKDDSIVVAHSRIVFPIYFFEEIMKSKFMIGSPKVSTSSGERYLDFCYSTYRFYKPARATKALWWVVPESYLAYTAKLDPYIDGGVFMINLNAVRLRRLFTTTLNWGEAEDIDFASKAYNNGYLLSYLHQIECVSLVDKLQHRFLILKKLLIKFLIKL